MAGEEDKEEEIVRKTFLTKNKVLHHAASSTLTCTSARAGHP